MPPFLPYCGIRGKFGLHAILLLSTIFAPSLASTRKQRRRLTPNESIAQFVRDEHSRGVARPEFTLIGERREKAGLFEAEQSREFDIDLVEANPAVTPETTYSTFHDGNKSHKPVGKSDFKFFVPADTRYTSEPAAFALIVINERTDEVHGIAQKNGDEMVTIAQKPLAGESLLTVVDPAEITFPENFSCGTADGRGAAEEYQVLWNPGERRTTSTANDSHFHTYDRDHDMQHEDGTGHAHAHSFTMNGKDGILPEIDILSKTLANNQEILQNRRKLYATDSFPQLYTYQVDFFIEIDSVFVDNNNGDLETAIQYVNAMVSAANIVFEKEVDTHLHVTHIALTNTYDNSVGTGPALSLMIDTYGSTEGWHYTEGYGIDLHHAILGRSLGGGMAVLGGICNSNNGFAVSADVGGSLGSLSSYGMYIFMHEVGHQFGTGHTHDSYDPIIDNCGNQDANGAYDCEGLPLENSVTIMSYCIVCSGKDNLLRTFGGHWIEGTRSKIENWANNPNLNGNISYEPRRVPKTMYDFVSTRECVVPNLPVPEVVCATDSDCTDGNSCTVDTCNGSSCSNTMSDECCGNFVCEAGESSCDDCGPFILQSPYCNGCHSSKAFMFDVKAGLSKIYLNALFVRLSGNSVDEVSVKIYTSSGSFRNNLESIRSWTLIASIDTIPSGWNDYKADFMFPLHMIPDEVRSFYVVGNGNILSGGIENQEILANDDYLEILNDGRKINEIDNYRFANGGDGYSWNGKIEYSIQPPGDPDCFQDSDCVDGVSCTLDTCNTLEGVCVNTMQEDCCGNGACEVNEVNAGNCLDCGSFMLHTPGCGPCYALRGIMFDVKSSSSSISLEQIVFTHKDSGFVRVYTALGPFSDHLSSLNSWTEVGSIDVTSSGWVRTAVDFTNTIEMSPFETRSFYLFSTGSMMNGRYGQDPVLASDKYLSIMDLAAKMDSEDPSTGGDGVGWYAWTGTFVYSLLTAAVLSPAPSMQPSSSSSPSSIPSSAPSSNPTTVLCTDMTQIDCCGNDVCEIADEGCKMDCGPFTLSAPGCNSCYAVRGIMFDVKSSFSSLLLEQIVFTHKDSGFVRVYTALGPFSDHLSSLNSWTEVGSIDVTSSGWVRTAVDFTNTIEMSPFETRSFYLFSTGSMMNGRYGQDPVLASDKYLSIMDLAAKMDSEDPSTGGNGAGWYAWNGRIVYTVNAGFAQPSASFSPSFSLMPSSPAWDPTLSPTPDPTWDPTLSPTFISISSTATPSSFETYKPTTASPTFSLRPSTTVKNCADATQTDCCGNGVCEVNEEDCGDCGPFILHTPECESCYVGVGFMFDVQSALSSVQLDGLMLWHRDSGFVTVYTASGTHINHLSSFDSWTEVASMNVTGTGWNTFQVDFNTPVKMKPAKTQSIFVTSTGLLSFGKIVDDTVVAYDEHLSIMNGGRYVSVADPSGSGDSGYAWEGAISYSLMPPIPTWDPTFSPTPNPTWDPTFSPTHDVPTGLPTGSPTASPTISPTGSPTTSPTGSPTTEVPTGPPVITPPELPTSSPTGVSTASSTESPTVDPTASPIVFPIASPTTSPTSSPTSSPTGSPTSSPTVSSTKNPTGSPISSPSSSPISSPTGTPTGSLTSSPISAPTGSPASPTLPTYSPTTSPTRSPVVTPTKSPAGSFTACDYPLWIAGYDYNQGDKVSFNDNVYTCRNKKGCDIRSPGLDNTWIFEGLCIPTAVPTPSPSTTLPTFSPTVEPTTSPTTLCGVPLWDNDANYSKGDQVVWFGGIYECTNKKTCDSFGPDSEEVVAWKYVGLCKETQSPTQSPSTPFPTFSPTFSPIVKFPTSAPTGLPTTSPIGCDLPAWVEGFDYNQGDKVSFNDYVYTCRNKKGCDIRSPGGDNTWIFEGLCIPTAVPTASPSTALPTFSPTVEPTYAPTTTCGVPLWDNDANYSKGDQVVWFGGVYECMDKKKCDSFGPGSEEVVAWKYVGLCEETQSPTQSPTTPFPTFSPTVSPVVGAP